MGRVSHPLSNVRGIGSTTAERLMRQVGIAASRRLAGLGQPQRRALINTCDRRPARHVGRGPVSRGALSIWREQRRAAGSDAGNEDDHDAITLDAERHVDDGDNHRGT
jgi:ribosomal protein S13